MISIEVGFTLYNEILHQWIHLYQGFALGFVHLIECNILSSFGQLVAPDFVGKLSDLALFL